MQPHSDKPTLSKTDTHMYHSRVLSIPRLKIWHSHNHALYKFFLLVLLLGLFSPAQQPIYNTQLLDAFFFDGFPSLETSAKSRFRAPTLSGPTRSSATAPLAPPLSGCCTHTHPASLLTPSRSSALVLATSFLPSRDSSIQWSYDLASQHFRYLQISIFRTAKLTCSST